MQDVRRNGRRAMDVDRRRDIGAELVFQLEQNPLCRLLADAGNLRETTGFLQRDGPRQLRDRQARQHRERDLRADAVHLDELAKRAAFVFAAEAVQQVRVFPHDEVSEKRDALTRRGQVIERAHRHVDFVCDALNVEQELRRILFEQNAGKTADHWERTFYANSKRPPRIR